MEHPMLNARGLSKQYPGVKALAEVDLALHSGQVHVLFGENGAGKSTLIGLLTGLRPPTEGSIEVAGRSYRSLTPALAKQLGIAAVLQEFSLVPELNVLDNLFLGREITRQGVLDRSAMRAAAQQLLDKLGFAIALDTLVADLSRAHRQMVEIAKALLARPRVLILDEPTASLSDHEADQLLALIERLRQEGVAILYVSHRLREIQALADRITVLRNGRKVGTIDGAGVQESTLVEMMTGRRIDNLFPALPPAPTDAPERLRVAGLTLRNRMLQDVSLHVRAGEIVGIAGLVGCGKSEIGRALYGLESIEGGHVQLGGQRVQPQSPRQMLQRGLCYFPSDRGSEGLALNRSVRENTSMAALDRPQIFRWGWLQRGSELAQTTQAMRQLALTPLATERAVEAYSGGNRQKVMLGRGLLRDLNVYIFDEPTVGVDVGAKVEIYQHILDLAAQGAAIVVISSELPEVLNLSHRVLVMHGGHLIAEFAGADKTEAHVLEAFFGRTPAAVASVSETKESVHECTV